MMAIDGSKKQKQTQNKEKVVIAKLQWMSEK